MEMVTGNIRKLYFKYLSAAFGSALISCIYGVVDSAMVGQYQGPDGTAALAVVAPVWNVIYSLGLLMGIGGSVLFSMKRGGERSGGSENQLFTASVIGSAVLAAVSWIVMIVFEEPILRFFGADDTLLPLAVSYLKPVMVVLPLFLFGQMLAAFLRNDGDPGLATAAVLSGGIFNVFGDYFFVFPCDMGMYGAGLATAIGCGISVIIMLTHFFRKKNTLRLVRVEKLPRRLWEISVTGFSTFFIDVAMGILTVLFNRQIMKFLGSDALAVYGPVINVSTFVQCSAYSVGQAAQPIISTNFGAHKGDRIRKTLRYAIGTTAVFGVFWTALSIACPNLYIRIFMNATPEIFAIAPGIIRAYAISFLLLPFNIFSTYYFQAIMQPKVSFVVSVERGLVVSGALILLLPLFLPAESIWYAMPITELVTALYVVYSMKKYTKHLPE
jgi:putative MATE family efflux protein